MPVAKHPATAPVMTAPSPRFVIHSGCSEHVARTLQLQPAELRDRCLVSRQLAQPTNRRASF
jgi:hypothetical protein